MDDVGDILMAVGGVMLVLGFGGLCLLGIWMAFSISLPLGLITLAICGFGIGVIGSMLTR